MNLKDYADFANENKACYLATVEGDQPRVRCLGMWYADETGFYFQAQTVKAMCKQLLKNPKVEVYFNTKDFSKAMRVCGKVRFIDDLEIRARCIKKGLSSRISALRSLGTLCLQYFTCILGRLTSGRWPTA